MFFNLILKQYDDWILRRSYGNIFHVRGTTEEKARYVNTLTVVPPYNRTASDVLNCVNITRRFKRLFRYPGLPINKVVYANHSNLKIIFVHICKHMVAAINIINKSYRNNNHIYYYYYDNNILIIIKPKM